MPHVIVKLFHGRSEEQKTPLDQAIVKDVVAIKKSDERIVACEYQREVDRS